MALLVLGPLLAACATPSAYGPANRAGGAGFTDARIEADCTGRRHEQRVHLDLRDLRVRSGDT